MSRPRRYTDEQIQAMLQQIDDAVALGETVSRAARIVGISDGLYYKWRQRLMQDTGARLAPRRPAPCPADTPTQPAPRHPFMVTLAMR
ncbi:hypothetical protein GCM10007860_15150 [Chitiniphilus shinanonensis]|uniref:HTH merR-type domain-containing protein n=1 Tax=Chitiniphilus shinanonensis TaxID=553088 RepID=A0ABQ6BWS2_9NEIS|nr:transposase [Chitiniphilus shinanonensis]GLS04368.1 hypothetical protein GCM10007860_15150 [Chitiniphilus shinanonensis]